jgi:hypothetical protein
MGCESGYRVRVRDQLIYQEGQGVLLDFLQATGLLLRLLVLFVLKAEHAQWCKEPYMI